MIGWFHLWNTSSRLQSSWKSCLYLQSNLKDFTRCIHQSTVSHFSVDPEENPKDDEAGKKETSAENKQKVQDKKNWDSTKPFNSFSKVVEQTKPQLQPVDLFRKFRIWMILRALRSIWGEENFTEELFLTGASSALTTVFECLESGDLSSLEDALGEEVYNALKEQTEQLNKQPHFALKEIVDKQVSNAFRYIDVPKKISFVALDVEFLMKLVVRNPETPSEEESGKDYYGITEVRFESPLSRVPIDPQKKIQIIKADFVKEPDWKLTRVLK